MPMDTFKEGRIAKPGEKMWPDKVSTVLHVAPEALKKDDFNFSPGYRAKERHSTMTNNMEIRGKFDRVFDKIVKDSNTKEREEEERLKRVSEFM